MRQSVHLAASLTLALAAPTFGQWSTTSLPHPRLAPAGTSLGTKVLFGGGNPGPSASSESAVVDIYDEVTGAWSSAQLSVPRTGLVAISVGSKALFAGGWDGSHLNAVDVYDDSTGAWGTHTLVQYGSVAVAAVGEKAFFGGGYVASPLGSGYSAAVTVYDAATQTWSALHLSMPRVSLSAASVGTKVLFAGGLGPGGLTNRVDIYDDATGSWSIAQLSVARGDMAAVTVGSKVLFAGGHANGGVVNRVDIYDDATGTWSVALLSESRQQPRAVAVGPLALIAGGQQGLVSVSDVVDTYDSRTGEWRVTQLSQARTSAGVAGLCDRAYFAGGTTTSPADNTTVDVYTFTEAVGQSFCVPAVRNSIGMPGLLCASGNPSALSGRVLLLAHDLPPSQFGLFLVAPSTATVPNFAGGAGTLCLGGGLGMYRAARSLQSGNSGGTLAWTLDPGQIPSPSGWVSIAPGETWYFQCWYRDLAGAFPTSNLTHGLSVTFH